MKSNTNFKSKRASILLICCLSLCAITLNSCSKESQFDETTWTGELKNSGSIYYSNYDLYYTCQLRHNLTFMFSGTTITINDKVRWTDIFGYPDSSSVTWTGVFSYNKPCITFNVDDEAWTGIVNKTTMTLNNLTLEDVDIDREIVILTRQ